MAACYLRQGQASRSAIASIAALEQLEATDDKGAGSEGGERGMGHGHDSRTPIELLALCTHGLLTQMEAWARTRQPRFLCAPTVLFSLPVDAGTITSTPAADSSAVAVAGSSPHARAIAAATAAAAGVRLGAGVIGSGLGMDSLLGSRPSTSSLGSGSSLSAGMGLGAGVGGGGSLGDIPPWLSTAGLTSPAVVAAAAAVFDPSSNVSPAAARGLSVALREALGLKPIRGGSGRAAGSGHGRARGGQATGSHTSGVGAVPVGVDGGAGGGGEGGTRTGLRGVAPLPSSAASDSTGAGGECDCVYCLEKESLSEEACGRAPALLVASPFRGPGLRCQAGSVDQGARFAGVY